MQKFILTIGPSLGSKIPLNEIHEDHFIYRINGAHGDINSIKNSVLNIRAQVPTAVILLDLPGNKIRTAGLNNGVKIKNGEDFTLKTTQFNYTKFHELLKPGMKIAANDSIFTFIVKSVATDEIVFTSHSDGVLLSNKGMHSLEIGGNLPFLFDKDRELIKIANELNISFIGASFVRKADDIKELKTLLNPNIKVISKIETLSAVQNLKEILDEVQYILIDRGDLSTEIGLAKIPRAQKYIVQLAHHLGKNVFLATQILKHMEHSPLPTISELENLYNIAKMGVYGVQLSEESAVGEFVKECINILKIVQNEIINERISL